MACQSNFHISTGTNCNRFEATKHCETKDVATLAECSAARWRRVLAAGCAAAIQLPPAHAARGGKRERTKEEGMVDISLASKVQGVVHYWKQTDVVCPVRYKAHLQLL